MKWFRVFGTAVTVFVITVAALSAAAQTRPVIRIGWQPDPNVSLYLAREKSWFEEAGLQPQYVKFISGPPMFAALQSESIDVAEIGLAPGIIGRGQGLDIKAFMISVDVSGSNALIAKKDVPVSSGRDLKGRRVAAVKGSTPYFGLVRFLERDGLSLGDIQYLDVSAQNMVPAFKRGEVDAIWVWSPWQNMLVGLGGKRITDNRQIGALSPNVWVVRTEWARKNPETLQTFMKVIDRAFQQIGANRELAIRQLSETLNVEPTMAEEILRSNEYPALQTQKSASYPLSVVAGYPGATAGLSLAAKRASEFLTSQGILKTPVGADDIVDPGPLKRYGESK